MLPMHRFEQIKLDNQLKRRSYDSELNEQMLNNDWIF